MFQVFGVDEQEAVRVSRLGGSDQRERLSSQRPGTGGRGKAGRLETEVKKRQEPEEQNKESLTFLCNVHL